MHSGLLNWPEMRKASRACSTAVDVLHVFVQQVSAGRELPHSLHLSLLMALCTSDRHGVLCCRTTAIKAMHAPHSSGELLAGFLPFLVVALVTKSGGVVVSALLTGALSLFDHNEMLATTRDALAWSCSVPVDAAVMHCIL